MLMGLPNYTEEDWLLLPSFEIQLSEEKDALRDGRFIRTVTNANEQLPKLLVKFIPFTPIDGIWSLDWIEQENPDIVIIEIAERSIDDTLPLLFSN